MDIQRLEVAAGTSGARRAAWFIAYAAMPVYAVFSGSSVATFLVIATVLLLGEALSNGRAGAELKAIARQVPENAPLILALLFAALGWLSLAWSPWPAETLRFAISITGVLALALAWVRFMRAGDLAAIERMMLLGVILASAVLLPALFGIFNLRALLVPGHYISEFNRGILVVCVFAAVLVALALGGRRSGALAWAALALAAISAFASGSETSKLFILAFPPLLVMYFITERVSGWLSVAVAPLIYFVFPLLVAPLRPLLEVASKIGFEDLMTASSAVARQEIWASFLEAAMQRPILGWGLGTERYVPLAGQVLDANGMGPWTHAHSLPIQTLVNLGLTGFIIAGGVIAAICLAIGRLPAASRAPAFALVTAMLVVWSISHGPWQSWWLALLLLALAPLFVQARGLNPPAGGYPS